MSLPSSPKPSLLQRHFVPVMRLIVPICELLRSWVAFVPVEFLLYVSASEDRRTRTAPFS